MTPGLPGPLPVVGVEHRLPVFAIGRTRRRTGELVPASIEIIVVAIGKRRPHHVGQRIGQGVEASVALAQRIAGRDEVRFQLSYRYGGPRGLRLALPNADRPDWLQQPSCFTTGAAASGAVTKLSCEAEGSRPGAVALHHAGCERGSATFVRPA